LPKQCNAVSDGVSAYGPPKPNYSPRRTLAITLGEMPRLHTPTTRRRAHWFSGKNRRREAFKLCLRPAADSSVSSFSASSSRTRLYGSRPPPPARNRLQARSLAPAASSPSTSSLRTSFSSPSSRLSLSRPQALSPPVSCRPDLPFGVFFCYVSH
jgi:hypothetical protein